MRFIVFYFAVKMATRQIKEGFYGEKNTTMGTKKLH